MTLKKTLKKLYFDFVKQITIYRNEKMEKRKIKQKRRMEIQKLVSLTKEQKKQIDTFYKTEYGKKIKYNWHKEYTAISGVFDYRYVPELLCTARMEELWNSPAYYKCLQDKNIIELLSKSLNSDKNLSFSIRSPKAYVRCANGLFLDGDYHIISKEEAILKMDSLDKFFIKPSVDSGSGKNCRIVHHEEWEKEKEQIFKDYNKDFIVQEVLHNSEDLARLNPTSCNTFRVITYILDNKIYHMPLVLRMGRNGKYLDNAHQGGIFIGVSEDGHLGKQAVTEFNEKYFVHPDSQITFENYHIENVDKIIEAAHQLQALIPHVGCVHWDLTIGDQGEVILMEGNMRGGSIWLVEMTGKAPFGENTARVLNLLRDNKNLF